MNANNLNEILIYEVSQNRMVLGQLICNSTRDDSHTCVDLTQVVTRWIYRCAKMSKTEWLVATEALDHYLKALDSESARAASKLLTEPAVVYDYHTRILRKTVPQLGKHKNEQTFLRSHELTKHAFAPDVEVAGVTQNPQLKNGGISESRRFKDACKSMIDRVLKCL